MARRSNSNAGGTRVYSTDGGGVCPGCQRRLPACVCATRHPFAGGAKAAAGDGVVRLRRETKGRKGAGVTLITGLALPPEQLAELARELKRRCGVGGAVKDGVIELQGEQRQQVKPLLEARGMTVKIAGG